MTCYFSGLGSAFDWLKQVSLAARPIRSTAQTWVVTRHQYGISEVVPQTLFRGKPAVASTNVGCFLMLAFLLFLCLFCNADFTMQPIRRHYVQAKILILFFWLCSVTKKSCWKTPVFEASYRSLNAMKARYESSWPLWNRLLWLL